MTALITTTSIILSIGMIAVLLLCSIVLYLNYSEQKKRRKLEELITYNELYEKSVDTMGTILDKFILEKLTEYKLFNPETFGDYINEKTEEEILRGVLRLCLEDMSPMLISHLCLIYNKSNIDSLLYKQVNLAVTSAVIENNSEWTVLDNR